MSSRLALLTFGAVSAAGMLSGVVATTAPAAHAATVANTVPAVPSEITITYFKRSVPAVVGCPVKAVTCSARYGDAPSQLDEFYSETFGPLGAAGTRPVAVTLLLREGGDLHSFTSTGSTSSNPAQIHSNDSFVIKAAQSAGQVGSQIKATPAAISDSYSGNGAAGESGVTYAASYGPNYTLNNYINWCWGGGIAGVHWGYVYNCGWWPGNGTPPATDVWASYGWGSQWSCNPQENGYYFGWANMNYSPNTGYYAQGTATCSTWEIPFYSRHPYVDTYVYANGTFALGPSSG